MTTACWTDILVTTNMRTLPGVHDAQCVQYSVACSTTVYCSSMQLQCPYYCILLHAIVYCTTVYTEYMLWPCLRWLLHHNSHCPTSFCSTLHVASHASSAVHSSTVYSSSMQFHDRCVDIDQSWVCSVFSHAASTLCTVSWAAELSELMHTVLVYTVLLQYTELLYILNNWVMAFSWNTFSEAEIIHYEGSTQQWQNSG